MVEAGSSLALERFPALVLNADFRPLSLAPLSLWSWQDAVRAIFRDAVQVVAEYDREIHSPSLTMKLPSVLVLKDYVDVNKAPAFTRFNVFLRDNWTCQYCGSPFKTHQLTFDHVIPRSKGGQSCWTNIVTACRPCNTRKGSRLCHDIGMFPRAMPVEPNIYQLQKLGRAYPENFLHDSWVDFIYWDTELQP